MNLLQNLVDIKIGIPNVICIRDDQFHRLVVVAVHLVIIIYSILLLIMSNIDNHRRIVNKITIDHLRVLCPACIRPLGTHGEFVEIGIFIDTTDAHIEHGWDQVATESDEDAHQ